MPSVRRHSTNGKLPFISGVALVLTLGVLLAACARTGNGAVAPVTTPTRTPLSKQPTPTATVPPAASKGILAGSVVMAANCPAATAEQPCPGLAVVSYTVTVQSKAGAVAGTARTDTNGHFSIQLAPGTYIIQPQNAPGMVPTHQIPTGTYIVTAGKTTLVQIVLETGVA